MANNNDEVLHPSQNLKTNVISIGSTYFFQVESITIDVQATTPRIHKKPTNPLPAVRVHPAENHRPSAQEKMNFATQKEEIAMRKNEAQLRIKQAVETLGALQLEALQFRRSAALSPESDQAQKDLADAEEKVRLSSAEFEQRVAVLRDVEALDKALELLKTNL